MNERYRNSRGFTMLEVTFATGILFLTFILLTVALAQLAGLREMGERRQLAVMCLNHCLEQVQQDGGAVVLSAPEELPGTYEIHMDPLGGTASTALMRLTVTTRTTRGHEIVVSATCAPQGVVRGS